MSNDSEFDPWEFYIAEYRKAIDSGDRIETVVRALAAESAKRQAMKDAGICRKQLQAFENPEGCAQAIEREAGL